MFRRTSRGLGVIAPHAKLCGKACDSGFAISNFSPNRNAANGCRIADDYFAAVAASASNDAALDGDKPKRDETARQ
jgi:hypothetical protein